MLIFEKISTTQLTHQSGFILGLSHIPQMMPTTHTTQDSMLLELCCPYSRMFTLLLQAQNGILRLNSLYYGTLGLQPVLWIIQNMSWLPKCHMTHTQCVKVIKVFPWGIKIFENSITKEISIVTPSFQRKLILSHCTL